MAGIVKLELDELVTPRVCEQTSLSWRYLKGTHASVAGLFDALHVVRLQKQAASGADSRGKLSNDEQDLLRAALVFTSAGLDACFKQLLRDALGLVIDVIPAAEKEFRTYVNERLNGPVSKDVREAITHRNPRTQLIGLYIGARTKPSLQNTNDLVQVRGALGIPESDLPDGRFATLSSFFAARNEIVHELDFNPSTGPGIPGRRQRTLKPVRNQCNDALQLVRDFLNLTARHMAKSQRGAQQR